jgi:hypothetical protein
MKNYFLIILVSILFSCNSNQQNTKQKEVELKSNKCFMYPSVIDSLQVRDLYDSARWYIYTFYCDKPYQPKEDSLPQSYFGQLELRFSDLVAKGDTIQINYNFFDSSGHLILPSMMKEYKPLITGVGFNRLNKNKIYMESQNGFSVVMKGGVGNRYENPLQPEVLAYIKNNLNKLNECFKELVERKGIIK